MERIAQARSARFRETPKAGKLSLYVATTTSRRKLFVMAVNLLRGATSELQNLEAKREKHITIISKKSGSVYRMTAKHRR